MSQLRIKKEYIFRLLVFWIWTETILLQYVRAVVMRLPFIGAYPDVVLTAVFIAVALMALPYYRMTRGDLMFLFSVVAVFLFQWLFHSEAQQYLDEYAVSFLIHNLPLYVLGVSLGESEEREQIIRMMYILSMITLAANFLNKMVIGTPMDAVTSKYVGDMDRAYKLLPHCCLIAYYSIKKTNPWNVGFTILGGFYLLLLGTRGAVLIYFAFVTVVMIMGRSSKWVVCRTVALFGVAGVFIVSPLYDASILWLYRTAQQLGLSIRVFEKMVSGTFYESNGRDWIRVTLLQAIKERPLLGHGICGDRVLLDGGFSHNILIELWIDFGLIFGTAAMIALLIILGLGHSRAQGEDEKGLILSLIFSSFCMMFLSGSYLDERLPLFLLGLCVSSIRKTKRSLDCQPETHIKEYHNYG